MTALLQQWLEFRAAPRCIDYTAQFVRQQNRRRSAKPGIEDDAFIAKFVEIIHRSMQRRVMLRDKGTVTATFRDDGKIFVTWTPAEGRWFTFYWRAARGDDWLIAAFAEAVAGHIVDRIRENEDFAAAFKPRWAERDIPVISAAEVAGNLQWMATAQGVPVDILDVEWCGSHDGFEVAWRLSHAPYTIGWVRACDATWVGEFRDAQHREPDGGDVQQQLLTTIAEAAGTAVTTGVTPA